jgi:holo-[acyl-carrier protein] synthase
MGEHREPVEVTATGKEPACRARKGRSAVILGLGIDLLETRRVEQELSRGDWLLADGIFTPEEITYCSAAGKPALRFAACFAAKEATCKALGLQVSDLGLFREAEVVPRNNGSYQVLLHGRLAAAAGALGVRSIALSMAHHGGQTSAIVMLEDGT